jgi:hypothetical protein
MIFAHINVEKNSISAQPQTPLVIVEHRGLHEIATRYKHH